MVDPALRGSTANRITLELLNNFSTRLEFSYSHLQKAARVGYGKHRRLFFVETTQNIRLKCTFKNEYGLEVGHLQFADKEKGILYFSGVTHEFKYENSTIVLFGEDSIERLITCNLKALKIEPIHNEREVQSLHACLLFAMGWSLEVQQQ